MSRRGGISSIYYKETHGIKVTGGQNVTAGTVLTREGDKWHPGQNVIGRTHLTAAVDGHIYFTYKRGSYKKAITLINVKPNAKPKAEKAEKAEKTRR